MQAIARLAGPVVHGFKRGSKLLGWLVSAYRQYLYTRILISLQAHSQLGRC